GGRQSTTLGGGLGGRQSTTLGGGLGGRQSTTLGSGQLGGIQSTTLGGGLGGIQPTTLGSGGLRQTPTYLPDSRSVVPQTHPPVDREIGPVTSEIQNLPSGIGILDLPETDLESTPDAPFYEQRGGLDLSGREKTLPLPTENLILD